MQKWKSLYSRAIQGERYMLDMEFTINDNFYFTTIHFSPIYNLNSQIIGACCYLQNVTERNIYLKRIEQQNKQLKEIAFITSHKVRVPLTNILGLTEILDVDHPLSASNLEIIEHIKTSAKELDKTIINMVHQTVYAND